MRKTQILIFIVILVVAGFSAMCLSERNSNLPSPTPFESPATITQTPENADFKKQVRITGLADALQNSNWSFYYPDEDPFKWDERTAALKLKPILESYKWSDGERVTGVEICQNITANRTFLLVNLSWGDVIVVEPVVNESYKNWSLYQIGRVYSLKDYPLRCDVRNGQ